MQRTLILDTEAMSLIARRDPLASEFIGVAARKGIRTVYPAVIIAELITGKPVDSAVWHAAGRLIAIDLTVPLAAAAGRLRERAGATRPKKRDITIDSIVAATAESLTPSTIITGDAGDMNRLVDGLDVKVVDITDPKFA